MVLLLLMERCRCGKRTIQLRRCIEFRLMPLCNGRHSPSPQLLSFASSLALLLHNVSKGGQDLQETLCSGIQFCAVRHHRDSIPNALIGSDVDIERCEFVC